MSNLNYINDLFKSLDFPDGSLTVSRPTYNTQSAQNTYAV